MKKKYLRFIYVGIVLIAVAMYLVNKNVFNRPDGEILIEAEVDSTMFVNAMDRFGVARDSFYVHQGRVGRNQNLSLVLRDYHVPYSVINKVALACDTIFDVRKIKYGNPYMIYLGKDSLATPHFFIYGHSPTQYLKVSLSESIQASLIEFPVSVKLERSHGVIETSLWNTLVDNSLDPNLANELSEIYAWSIDFFGLQKGDSFNIVYQKQYVDTNYVGLGKVITASLTHQDSSYYAFWFEQDSTGDYFDIEGNSLRKAFLKAPLRFSRVSSRFSNNRFHPVLKIHRPHHGVDYAAPAGTPVYAIGDGKIIKKGYESGGGNYVKIKHNGTYTTVYMHLSRFASGLSVNQQVKQGQVIGYVGSTGLATGPHLDFRFYRNGQPIDPLKVEAPPVEPVKENNRALFDSLAQAQLLALNAAGWYHLEQ
ncbi:MAG: peptidoglycan DD-metalloendopeptidase family protein [Bacteroidales bacterium]|nr:peptidoglycan DD-metalloendopeptidase family protein [Bacteroidales bacterium]